MKGVFEASAEAPRIAAGVLRIGSAAKASFQPIQFAPFDIQCFIRVALLVLLWKHASQDYGALASLGTRPPIFQLAPGLVNLLAVQVQTKLLISESIVTVLQLTGVAACLVALVKPGRMSLAGAFAAVAIIEYPAYFWRLQTWDIDLPLAVIFFVLVAPWSVSKSMSPSRVPNWESNSIGWMLGLYLTLMYFLAGIAKLIFSMAWASDVKLGNNWRTQFLDATPYSSISAITAEPLSYLFLSLPLLSTAIAATVLIDQLIMPLAMINRHVRRVGPVVIFLNHVGIAAALGIFFASMPFLGPGIFMPWSRLFPSPGEQGSQLCEAEDTTRTGKQKILTTLACMLAIYLVMLPALTNTIYHPFANNMTFGWRYRHPDEYKDRIVLGYFDASMAEYRPVPRGYGGFLEFRHTYLMNVYAAEVLKSGEHRANYMPHIETLLCASRPSNSNRHLLSILALPDHRWSFYPKGFDVRKLDEIYILKGSANSEDLRDPYKVVRVHWSPIESFRNPCRL